jgi:hypothetical protein
MVEFNSWAVTRGVAVSVSPVAMAFTGKASVLELLLIVVNEQLYTRSLLVLKTLLVTSTILSTKFSFSNCRGMRLIRLFLSVQLRLK